MQELVLGLVVGNDLDRDGMRDGDSRYDSFN